RRCDLRHIFSYLFFHVIIEVTTERAVADQDRSMSVAKAPLIERLIPSISGILPRLPQDLSAQLFAGAPSRHLKSGEALFLAGDTGNGCYLLNQGILKVVISS